MSRKSITVGEFVVSCAPAVLETFLGSCVGVALYDPQQRVGGLLHVVLPEGPATKELSQPAMYARSGVPLLINELEAAGASRGRLQAEIAGGAHIRARKKDLDLKIGFRNILAVRTALEKEAIPILQEDIGGDFGRQMSFDLDDGKVKIRASLSLPANMEKTPYAVRTVTSDIINETIASLKPVSDVALKALDLARDPKSSFFEIERLILQDQVLAAMVLRLANSAYYGVSREIATISQALSRLGLAAFRKIVMQSLVHHLFARKLFAYSMEEGALFQHSLACAQLAELLAKEVPDMDCETVYMAGLVHDIGKVVLERCGGPQFNTVMDKVLFGRIPFHEAEEAVFGVDHAAVGRQMAEIWKLPEGLCEVIAMHHRPGLSQKARDLVNLVHVANMLCNLLGIGMGAATMSNRFDQRAFQELGLNERTVEKLLAEIPKVLHQYAGKF